MLSEAQVRNAKPSGRPVKIADGGGLYLAVMPNGGRYWRFDYRFLGKRKTLALGTYPDVLLATARARHQDARRELSQGIDPAAQKQIEITTFETVAREWYARWKVGRNQQYAFYVLKRLETDVFPAFGAKPISDVPASFFRQAVQKIEQRGAAEIAKRVLQNCSQIMRYAVANDMAERNPVADVRPADILKPRKKRNHPRVSAKELPTLLQAIDGYVGNEHTVLALQLMALTFVRTSELIGARWPEFDFKIARWEIPKERMKMKTPHIVAMSTQTIAVLEKLKSISFNRDLVFPGDVDPNKPMSNNTLLYALYRMGYRSRMTGHGFRGVASTILHEQGWPHEHIELQLAHEERDETSAAYNYALYLKPRAEMMQAWADHLDKLRYRQSDANQEHQS